MHCPRRDEADRDVGMAAVFGLIAVPGLALDGRRSHGFRRAHHDQETSRHEEPGAEQDQGQRDPGPLSAGSCGHP